MNNSLNKLPKVPNQKFQRKYQVSGWDDDFEGVEQEIDPHGKPESEILWASENNKLSLIKTLLTQNPEIVNTKDKDGYTPLHRACYSNNSEVVELLITCGGNIFSQTLDLWQPLHSACKWNNTLCASKLLNAGADINCKSRGGQTPLHLAASNGNAKTTLLFLLMRPDLKPFIKNDSDETALDIASRTGKYYILFEIVESSINKL